MQQSQRMASTASVQWRWIWNLRCTERVKFFIWLLRRGRVLTNSVRFDRHIASSPMCPRCEQATETPIHLLRDCYYSRLVWEVSDYLPSDFFHLDFDSWLFKNSVHSHSLGSSQSTWASLFPVVLWSLWKSRNKLVFDGKWIAPQTVFQQAKSLAFETVLVLNSSVLSPLPREHRWVRWLPPDPPFLKLNTDGSRSHQSRRACAGGLIRDHQGHWIHGFTVNIGATSSFIAELWGCREGLRLALSLGIQHLILEMDSLMAVQLIQARKIGNGSFSVLLADILVLSDAFTDCLVQHTLREGNAAADYMAALGHNSTPGITIFQDPPVGISMIMHGDCVGASFLRV
ncbi:hypothetical protein SLEP1_g1697 [Rubroshorea leprosula]|uniref:RNase H type-1 domain-containing protein n=1 Tax=Rubroshorea leprosula TaxID=152421 RepID=A0AAV5HLA8_9ROSI|nr:hypothetical protein SLEP1_g1697 [Rubroshorea leprosula]